jgi:hypothetical protein
MGINPATGFPELELPAAAIPGTLLATKGGLLIIVPVGLARDDCVATDDVEFDRVGLEGLMLPLTTASAGWGAVGYEEVR